MSTHPAAAAVSGPVPAPAVGERIAGPRSGARRRLPQPPARLYPLYPRTVRRRAAALAPWLLAGFFAAVYAVDSVQRYLQFRTASWDLALFTEAVKQYAHFHAPIVDARAPGFDLLGEHFHPILALLAPLYAIKPSPVTLLLAQALLFASSIPPVVSLARERLGPKSGYVLGAAYGASFGVVQAVDFDFHELAFAAPLIALALLALLRDRDRLLVLACVGLLCTKEEFGVTMVLPLGIAWMLRDRTRWKRRLPLALFGVVASALQVFWLIPELNPSHVYGFLADTGAVGSTGNVEGIGQFFADFGAKVHLLVLLGLATAFASLLSPLALLAIPDLVMRFASSNTYYWGSLYHYNSVLMPILFVAAIDGLSRRQIRRIANLSRLGVAAIGLAALWMVPFQGFGQVFSARQYAPSPLHIQALRSAIREIPAGATVESGINTLAPLAAKADAFWSGNGAIDPAPEYVVYDTVYEPQTAGEQLASSQVIALADEWHPLASYVIISSQDGVDVLRKL